MKHMQTKCHYAVPFHLKNQKMQYFQPRQIRFWIDVENCAINEANNASSKKCSNTKCILASRQTHFACRRAHLLFYTPPFFPFQPVFWHRGPPFWHVDGRILHLDGHIYFFTLHHFFPFQPVFWHRGPPFWHVDGRILHLDGHIDYFTLYYFSFPVYFLASRAVILTCRTPHCARRRTHLLFYFTIFPFQPTFWHRGPSC